MRCGGGWMVAEIGCETERTQNDTLNSHVFQTCCSRQCNCDGCMSRSGRWPWFVRNSMYLPFNTFSFQLCWHSIMAHDCMKASWTVNHMLRADKSMLSQLSASDT